MIVRRAWCRVRPGLGIVAHLTGKEGGRKIRLTPVTVELG